MADVYWASGSADYEFAGLDIDVDELGFSKVTEKYSCKDDAAVKAALTYDASDCIFPLSNTEKAPGAAGKRVEGGMWEATRTYRGVIDSNAIDNDEFVEVTLTSRARSEPIAANPNFEAFAGTADSPADGAEFDDDGEFKQFSTYLADGSENPKAGITNFWSPAIVHKDSRLISESEAGNYADELDTVVDSPPDHPLTMQFAKRNWLITGLAFKAAGSGVSRMERTYTCSGPRGWDTDFNDE
jgi:hypothetical protein